jgi:hypothetical protein
MHRYIQQVGTSCVKRKTDHSSPLKSRSRCPKKPKLQGR